MARDDAHATATGEHRNPGHRMAEQRSPHSESGSTPESYLNRPVVTTAAVIGIAALFEPELLLGMAIGAGVALASSRLPDVVGGTVRPLFKTAIKAGYAAASMAREMAAEASESVQDILAEARAEREPES